MALETQVALYAERFGHRDRNGGRSLEELVHHIGEDTLVGWGWTPGYGRAPAPGTQSQAGALARAWVQTGAVCPN